MTKAKKKSMFLSYSRKDKNIVAPIAKLLRVNSSDIFRDEDSILPGELWETEITDSIKTSDVFLIFWSSNSKKSSYVKKEYILALSLNIKIIPVLINNIPLPKGISKYQSINMIGVFKKVKSGNIMRKIVLSVLTTLIVIMIYSIVRNDSNIFQNALIGFLLSFISFLIVDKRFNLNKDVALEFEKLYTEAFPQDHNIEQYYTRHNFFKRQSLSRDDDDGDIEGDTSGGGSDGGDD